MKKPSTAPKNFAEYSAGLPAEVRKPLVALRRIIRAAAPQATEKISYRMPTFDHNGWLVYFGAFKNHIGLYPGAVAISKFKKDLARFKSSKGAVQFPLDQALPAALVTRIVKYRLKERSKKTR